MYWKQIYLDIKEYCNSCEICLRAKRNSSFRITPLHPPPIPLAPFQQWQIDHKNITRKIKLGNVAILCIVDSFSTWPILVPVPNMSAVTTAKVLFKEVISTYDVPSSILSDSGSAFCARFFTALMKVMNTKHRISAVGVARTNGLAENLVKKFSQLAKIHSDDDTEIEQAIPLMVMSLRAIAHTKMQLSSFEVVLGRKMNVGDPNFKENLPDFNEGSDYFNWLTHRLAEIHRAVRENKIEGKEEHKRGYDKHNKV